MVKIADKEKPKEPKPKEEDDNEPMGLPQMIFAFQEAKEDVENSVTWDDVFSATGLEMEYKTVIIPEAEGDTLISIIINMDSSVLKDFISKYRNPNAEQIEVAHRKYYTTAYFHTLFLYTITKSRGYEIRQKKEGSDDYFNVELGGYLKDLFDNYYSVFILNFGGMEDMMQGLGD